MSDEQVLPVGLGLNVRITTCNAAWGPPVPGVSLYEIHVDGRKVATSKITAAKIGLKDGQTVIEVFAMGANGEVLARGVVAMAGNGGG